MIKLYGCVGEEFEITMVMHDLDKHKEAADREYGGKKIKTFNIKLTVISKYLLFISHYIPTKKRIDKDLAKKL